MTEQFTDVHNYVRRGTHLLSSRLVNVDRNLNEDFTQIQEIFGNVRKQFDQNLAQIDQKFVQLDRKNGENLAQIQNSVAYEMGNIDETLRKLQRDLNSVVRGTEISITSAHQETLERLNRMSNEIKIAEKDLQFMRTSQLKIA